MLKKKANKKRKKVIKSPLFDEKRSSQLIQELKTAKGQRAKQIIEEMERMH